MVARHIPGYRYCGPGTEDFTATPRNRLDAACRQHDLAYSQAQGRLDRVQADVKLYLAARANRFRYPIASRIVETAMLTAAGVWYSG